LPGAIGSDCLLTADRELVIARRIAFDAFDIFCPAEDERDDDCDFAIVSLSY
jgi:hypothetical protein